MYKKYQQKTNIIIQIREQINDIFTWFNLHIAEYRYLDSRYARIVCKHNSGWLNLWIINTYKSNWPRIQNPKMTIFIHDLLQQYNFQNITVQRLHILLHIYSSYSKIKPQANQVLEDIHMTWIRKHQNEGHQGSRSSNGSHDEIKGR